MYIVRKISPWQDQNKLYPFGNPAVGVFGNLEDAIVKKNEWEIQCLKQNGITNSFEYWNVDCTNELLNLNDFLYKKYDIEILTNGRNKEYLNIGDIMPTMFPEGFLDNDYLSVQEVMERYYYKIEECDKSEKFVIVFNNDIIGWLNEESGVARSIRFKSYETENDAIEEVKNATLKKMIKCSNGTYHLVGPIREKEFSAQTIALLTKYPEITYDYGSHATGQQFISQLNLDEVDNGFNKLLEILKSVNKNIFQIKQLK